MGNCRNNEKYGKLWARVSEAHVPADIGLPDRNRNEHLTWTTNSDKSVATVQNVS